MPFLTQACRSELLVGSKKKLETAYLALQECAGGMAGGQDWLKGHGFTTFDELYTHAEQTLLLQDPKTLADASNTLQEASHHDLKQKWQRVSLDLENQTLYIKRGIMGMKRWDVNLAFPEAMADFEATHGCFGEKKDEELWLQIKAAKMMAVITRAHACLFRAFGTKKAEALRTQVQAEVRELRAQGLHERDCLAKPLFEKVKGALAGRL